MAPDAAPHAPVMKVLAIPGSLRRGSHNHALLRAAVELAPPGMVIEIFDGLAAIQPFDADREPAPGQSVLDLRRAVAGADGVLVATPEYNQSFPGVLKNAVDWLSRPAPEQVLVAKPVALLGASTGRWGTRLAQAALRQVFAATDSLVLPSPSLFVRDAERVFDPTGRLTDRETSEALSLLLQAFARWIERVAMRGEASR